MTGWHQGDKGRILVMDDEETIRKMLGVMLPAVGYEVEVAGDGNEAIEKYLEARESGRPFAAVIMDLSVPGGMGGKEAAVKLRKIDPDVKMIVSSGYPGDPVVKDYQKYGFVAVANKPYSIDQMEKTLGDIFKQ